MVQIPSLDHKIHLAGRSPPKHGPKISAPKLSHLVADALRGQIGNRELRPGDPLKSESGLLRHFGVSRPTLREALRVLESEGLIRLGRGARTGATVLGPSTDAVARCAEMYLATRETSLGHVFQVRAMLEPPWVALLAKRPRPQLVRALEDCVAGQRGGLAKRDYVAATSALNQFHRRMVEFSENPALTLFAEILEGITNKVYRRFLGSGDTSAHKAFRRRTAVSVEAHAKLVKLIAAGSPKGARLFWQTYMNATLTFLELTGLAAMRVEMPVSFA